MARCGNERMQICCSPSSAGTWCSSLPSVAVRLGVVVHFWLWRCPARAGQCCLSRCGELGSLGCSSLRSELVRSRGAGTQRDSLWRIAERCACECAVLRLPLVGRVQFGCSRSRPARRKCSREWCPEKRIQAGTHGVIDGGPWLAGRERLRALGPPAGTCGSRALWIISSKH